MKMENNWRYKTLENLEKDIWPPLGPNEDTYLIKTCHGLRKKVLNDFTTEDLRIMIGQEIGLDFLIPLALETLKKNLFAEGDYFEGDLLKNVLQINTHFWDKNKNYWFQLNELIKNRKDDISNLKFNADKFYNSKHFMPVS